jgi:hypothetical protein
MASRRFLKGNIMEIVWFLAFLIVPTLIAGIAMIIAGEW